MPEQMRARAAMSQTLLEPEHVDLALRQIADARELLRQASDTLSAPATSVVGRGGGSQRAGGK